MKRNEVDRSKLSPMMKHYVELKDKYEDTIILYRLGDFYEMFFEDAEVVAHALELTLTGKSAGLEERVPMCCIPHHASEIYIDKLIKKGFKVAICEQLEDPKTAKGIVKRDIVEVISSGTIINANSLNEKENNYIGSLYDFGYGYALTYSDITTGEIYSSLYNTNSDIIYKILSLEVKELIVNKEIDKNLVSKIKSQKIPVTIEDNLLENKYSEIYTNINDERIIKSIELLLYFLIILFTAVLFSPAFSLHSATTSSFKLDLLGCCDTSALASDSSVESTSTSASPIWNASKIKYLDR